MMQPGKDKDDQTPAPPSVDDGATEPTEATEEILDQDSADDDAAPELSAEEILRAERDQFEEKWLRAVAEMDNVRKRSRRDVADSRRFAQADMLRAFLKVLDNIERALAMEPEAETEAGQDGFRDGVELVFQQYRDILKEQGVIPIEALATEFDPVNHEAVGQLEREGVESGQVIEIVQQGYMFGDMVLRPARVIIAT